jgi:predicted Zn-dependent protease
LSSRPALVAGTIAFRLGDVARARRKFEAAVSRDPDNPYGTLELGLAYALQGRRADALRSLEASRRADPRDDLARSAIAVVSRGRRPDVAAINALIRGRAAARLR